MPSAADAILVVHALFVLFVVGGLLARAWSELPVEWGYDRD